VTVIEDLLHGGKYRLDHGVTKTWGNERWLVNGPDYCGKILTFRAGESCSIHMHREKHEVFVLLRGAVRVTLWERCGEDGKLRDGFAVFTLRDDEDHPRIVVPPLTPHQIEGYGLSGGAIIEISTTHRDEDSYRFTGPNGYSTAQGPKGTASDLGSIPSGSTTIEEGRR